MVIRITNTFAKSVKYEGKQRRYMDAVEAGFGLVVGAKRRTFIVLVRVKGKQKTETVGYFPEISADQAREKARAKRAQLRDGWSSASTFGELIDEFMKVRGPQLADNTIEQYKRVSENQFGDWRSLSHDALTVERCRKHFHDVTADRGPTAANQALGFAKSVINWSISRGSLPQNFINPWVHVKPNKRSARDRWLSKAELKRYWEALDKLQGEGRRWQMSFWALRYLLLTGRRRNEALTLRWDMLNLDEARVDYPRTKSGPKTFSLPEPVVEMLRSIPKIKGCDFVFASFGKANTAVNKYTLQGTHKAICEEAGLDELQIHDIRRTVGSQLLNAGGRLEDVSELLGHSNVVITQKVYAHVSNATREKVANQAANVMLSVLDEDGD